MTPRRLLDFQYRVFIENGFQSQEIGLQSLRLPFPWILKMRIDFISNPSAGLSWVLLLGLGTAVVGAPSGCAPIEAEEKTPWLPGADVTSVLANVGPSMVLPGIARFVDATDRLSIAIADWAAGPSESTRAVVQEEWTTSMLIWQELEIAQIGPAGSSLSVVGGEDIRDEIYSWPTVNGCRVDEELVNGGFQASDWHDTQLVNTVGMDALEHLLFSDSICDAVDTSTWNTLDASAQDAQRAAMAMVLVEGLTVSAQQLADRWAPDGGDFGADLDRSAPATPYASSKDALNAVFDALYYVDAVVRKKKVAVPAGIDGCDKETCPEDAEHTTSELGVAAIQANLTGFRNLWTGGDAAGLDDLLSELGHRAVSDEVVSTVDAALAITASASTPNMAAWVAQEPDKVSELYDTLHHLSDILTTDVVTVLSLDVPQESSGDND